MKIFNIMTDSYYITTFFIFGLFLGSFFNVVGYRLPQKKSIVKPGSACPNCNHKLSPEELIPIFSYFFQKRKCTKCNIKISLIYPIYELLTAILFAGAFYQFGFTLELIYALILISGLLIIINSDIRYMIIPDKVLLFTISGLLIIDLIKMDFSAIAMKLIAAISIFLILFIIKKIGNFLFNEESLGDGDIKLMCLVGYALGIGNSIIIIFIASFIALFFALYILKKKNKNIIPFGPFLASVTIILYISKFDLLNIILGK